MSENVSGASLDEGAISFHKIGDEFFIDGVDLEPGDEITHYTADGEPRPLIVDDIVTVAHGITTARFHWKDSPRADLYMDGSVYFHDHDGESTIRGLDLAEGDVVEVSAKSGKTYTVTVGEIIDTDENLVTARFTWNDDHPDRIIFRHDEDTDSYYIQGRDLVAGENVPVTTKSGRTVRVIVEQIRSNTDGLQTASYSWPPRD